jgi:hypothetical protein
MVNERLVPAAALGAPPLELVVRQAAHQISS